MFEVNSMKARGSILSVLTATAALLGVVSVAQAEIRVGPNYRLSSDGAPFRGQDQVAFATRPGNPQHVVEINANYLDSTCEATASLDGGNTWSPAFTLPLPGPSGNLLGFNKGCTNTVGLSPYVEFGSGQTVYTVATSQRQDIGGFPQNPSALLYKSTNGGLTWQQPVIAMQGSVSGPNPNITPGPSWYRPSLSVDRGQGAGGADRVYLVARDLRTVDGGDCPTAQSPSFNPCTSAMKSVVSNDGGQTFSAPVRIGPANINTADFPSKPVVNPDRSVTVAWRTAGVSALIQVARSTDGGQSWGNPINVTRVSNNGTPVTSHVPTNPPTGQSASASYPRMDGADGRLYMVYHQGGTGPTPASRAYRGADHFINPDGQVWFQRSLDGGLTWSQPKRISEQVSLPGARTHQTRHPTISVSPSGRINVVWHDRRHWYQGAGERNCTHSHIFCEDIRLGDTYYSFSTDGGVNFSKPLRISDRSSNDDVGYDTRPSRYWWFGPQAVGVGGDRVLIGWMDSREGNWDTDTDDIYLAKVDFNASGAAARTHVDAGDAVSRSVAISKLAYRGGNEGALVGGPRDPANPPGCTAANCPTGPASRNASAVVIVNQGDVAGALAGSVLGRANPAPVLLSPAGGLPASVKAEVRRIAPAGAYVIGNSTKLSEQVVADLSAAGVPAGQITRLSGANDADNAAQIAARLDPRTTAEKAAGTPAFDAVVIANPARPDAVAAAGLAAARRLPVLHVNADSIPGETSAALASLNIDRTLIVGSTASVGATVAGQLATRSPTRLGGADQYATSKAVLDESKERGLPGNVVYVADGSRPMDAALLGGAAARATGLLMLSPGPLYSRAAGQASAFGLSGIDRFIVAGPPPPGAVRPAPKPTYPGPGSVASFAGCPTLTANVIQGTAARNTIRGTERGDRIFAGAGNDRVSALGGNDCVDLGSGADNGQGGSGNDLLLGGRGKDKITGSAGKDKITGGADADSLNGGSGNDRITGGAAKDRIAGGSGKDRISSGSGNDRISARDRRRDRISCGAGRRDTVTADRIDRVARNCERVRRRR